MTHNRSRLPELALVVVTVALGALFSARPGSSAKAPAATATVAAEPPRDGSLMLYMPLDGTAEDHGPHRLACNARGVQPAPDRHGNPTGAMRFAGSGLIHIPEASRFNGMEEFTLSAWVRPEIRQEHLNVFSKVTPYRDFNLQIDALGRPVTHIMANGYEFCYAETPIPLNEWTQITATYRQHTWKMYLNGRMDNQVQVRFDPRWVGEHMTVGALQAHGGEYFQGSMDDLRIYSRALTPEEIHGPPTN